MKLNKVIGQIDAREENVHIWGAGFSGLISGFYLKQRGFKVHLYEKSSRIGGKIGTFKNDYGIYEIGANAFYMNADAMDLFKDLNLEVLPAAKKLKRYLFLNGKFKKPMSLSFISHILIHIMKRPPLITEGLTIAEFFRPLLGEYYIKNFLSPVLGGIYSTTADELHFKSIFPNFEGVTQFKSYRHFVSVLMREKRKSPQLETKGSVSFDGGMQTLIDKLGLYLKEEIKLNYNKPFQLKTNTIICTDGLIAGELLKELRPELSFELQRIEYRPLTTTTLFLRKEIKHLSSSFGVLIPPEEGLHSIGILNNKNIFPSNNQNVFSYTFISPGEINFETLQEDLKKINPQLRENDIEKWETTFWKKGLPLYNLQRYLAVKKLHQVLQKEKGLMIFGNYVAGISLREMTTAARTFVRSI